MFHIDVDPGFLVIKTLINSALSTAAMASKY